MRFSVAAAVALCTSVLAFAALYTAASRASTTATQPPASPPASADSADAAAKHAKLTECLKQAKERKLVGAAKTAFVKDCTSRP